MIEKRHFYSSKASFLTQRWIVWVFWLCLILIITAVWPSGCYFVSFKAFTSKQTYPTIPLHLNWSLQRPLGFNDTNQVYVSCTLYCLGQFEWNVAWIFPTCSNWMFFLEQIYCKSSFGGFPFIFLLSHLHPFTCPAQRMSPICKIMIT